MAGNTPPAEDTVGNAQTDDSKARKVLKLLTKTLEAPGRFLARKPRAPQDQKIFAVKSAPAVDQVFAVTELLENILFFMPARELLIDQIVCRKWRAVIKSNCKLQQALWMQPREVKEDFFLIPRIHRERLIGPINPFMFEVFKPVQDLHSSFVLNGIPTKLPHVAIFQDWSDDKKKRTAMLRKEASWRNMLICETYFCMVAVPKSLDLTQIRATTLDGPRLGAFYDINYALKAYSQPCALLAFMYTLEFNPPTRLLKLSEMSIQNAFFCNHALTAILNANLTATPRGLKATFDRIKCKHSTRKLKSALYGSKAQEVIDWIIAGECGTLMFWLPQCDENGRYPTQAGGEKVWELPSDFQ